MNGSIILYIVGVILNVEAVLMTLPCVVALLYGEQELWAFLFTMALCLAAGIPLSILPGRRKRAFYTREGFVAVALSWITLSFMGALPFVFSGAIPHIIDAVFEAVSGFTTTGASILTEVESLPRCILFWRSFTHWIGGMGVLVLILSILPLAGGYNMSLMKAESPGPSVSKLVPRVRSTAKILYGMYFLISVVQFIFLLLGKMPVFEALTTTFGTAGTGGFGVKNDSMAGYSLYLQNVVTIFMILFGVNFNAYFYIFSRRPGQIFKMEELRYYLGIITASIVVIAFNIRSFFPTLGKAFQQAAFQVASIITTTGFATTDFDLWPAVSKTILVMLMFVGACAGSTGGGIKVSRLVILLKTIKKEISLFLHPQSVRKINMDGKSIDDEVVNSVNVFIITYFIIFSFSVLLMGFDELDLVTNFTAVAATLNNIGPGLGLVGPVQNFSVFTDTSKIILIFDMLAGRLEIIPLLLLFMPQTWKRF